MKPRWDALVTRAAGLATHLLPAELLDELSRIEDLAALAARLAHLGIEAAHEGDGLAACLEHGARRWAGSRLRQLAAWCRSAPEPISIFLRDEDRRSLRRLVRGAISGAPPATRLAGLIPTEALPERVLVELARRTSLTEIATLLVAWGNPFGVALHSLGAAPRPEPLAVEIALDRCWGERGLEDASRVKGAFLWHVEESIDLANVRTLIVMNSQREQRGKTGFFLAGGHWLDEKAYSELATLAEQSILISALKRRLAGSVFFPALSVLETKRGDFEQAVLEERIREISKQALSDPLSGAPLLRFLLRLRAQVVELSRIVWERALGAPLSPALRLQEPAL